jgi:hypothetical protein
VYVGDRMAEKGSKRLQSSEGCAKGSGRASQTQGKSLRGADKEFC